MSRSRSRSPFRTPPTGRSSVSLDTLAKIQSTRPASPPLGGRRSAFRPPKNLKEPTTCLPRVVCRDLFNCPELRSDETCLDPDAKPPFLWRRIDKFARDRGQENNTLQMMEAERPVSPPKRCEHVMSNQSSEKCCSRQAPEWLLDILF
jgi:hypothetical protein